MASQVPQQPPDVALPNFAPLSSLCTRIDMSPNPVQSTGHDPVEERVAILAGSFDPITNGHVLLGCEIIHSGKADAVWLVPCGKADAVRERHGKLPLNIPYIHRLTMCHLALECSVGTKFPMQVCDVECIGELKRQYPDKTFSLVCGSELLPSLLWWFEGEDQTKFLQNDFLIVPRHGHELEKQMDKGNWPDWVKNKGIAEWPEGFDGGRLPSNFSMLDKSGIGKETISLKLSSLEARDRMKISRDMAEGLIPAPVLNHMIRYSLHDTFKEYRIDPVLGKLVTFDEMVRMHAERGQPAGQSYWEGLETQAAEPTWEESALKNLMAQEHTRIHILPDDTIEWMWGDASIIGHSVAKMNPLRWSSAKNPMETIAELQTYDLQKAVLLIVKRAGTEVLEKRFETVADAAFELRAQVQQ